MTYGLLVTCIFLYGPTCYEKPSDKDRVGMTNYLTEKYGNKKRRKYTKHKRHFKVEKKGPWDNSYD